MMFIAALAEEPTTSPDPSTGMFPCRMKHTRAEDLDNSHVKALFDLIPGNIGASGGGIGTSGSASPASSAAASPASASSSGSHAAGVELLVWTADTSSPTSTLSLFQELAGRRLGKEWDQLRPDDREAAVTVAGLWDLASPGLGKVPPVGASEAVLRVLLILHKYRVDFAKKIASKKSEEALMLLEFMPFMELVLYGMHIGLGPEARVKFTAYVVRG